MATTQQMQEQIEVFARQLADQWGEVDESLGVCWLDAIENQAIEIGDALAAEIAKQKSIHRPLCEEAQCPACHHLGQYRGTRARELLGRRGPVIVAEPEYYCPACRRAFFPDDPLDRRGT